MTLSMGCSGTEWKRCVRVSTRHGSNNRAAGFALLKNERSDCMKLLLIERCDFPSKSIFILTI